MDLIDIYRTVQQDIIKVLNMFTMNKIALKYIKQKLTKLKKRKTNKFIITVYFKNNATIHSVTDGTCRQKISMHTEDLNNMINKSDYINTHTHIHTHTHTHIYIHKKMYSPKLQNVYTFQLFNCTENVCIH